MKIFENIVGQSQVIETLKNAVIAARENSELSQKMTHSWLFTGSPGSGKLTIAKAFAAALVCQENGCDECIDCKTAMNESHVDIEIIKTKGSIIKVDEIRELISRTSLLPSMSRWRIFVVQNAHQLSESATNALLKAIEEPSPRVVWLLTATTLLDINPTLSSRCRQIQLRTLTKESLIEQLTKQGIVDIDMAKFCAGVSQGHIGRAKFLLENPSSRLRRNEITNLFFQGKDINQVFSISARIIEIIHEEAEEFYKNIYKINSQPEEKMLIDRKIKNQFTSEVIDNYLIDIEFTLSDAMIIKLVSKQVSDENNIDELGKIILSQLKLTQILEILSIVLQTRLNLQKNISVNLAIEDLLIKIWEVTEAKL